MSIFYFYIKQNILCTFRNKCKIKCLGGLSVSCEFRPQWDGEKPCSYQRYMGGFKALGLTLVSFTAPLYCEICKWNQRLVTVFFGSCIHRYILFDGDVDALWVENMNSVMDDNKLLTLANGERIRLQSHCALLFEVGNEYTIRYMGRVRYS